ncbi:hypothetical protein JST97_20705 [bacterium]|nr:hypothetical protein [bacterium]
MAINPNHTSIHSTTPVRSLNQLGPLQKARPTEEQQQVAGDQVHIQQPAVNTSADVKQKPSPSWLKRTVFAAGLTALAVAGGMGGSMIMAGMSPAKADSAHVQVVKQTKTAPTTLLQHQQEPTHLLTARIGVTPSVHELGDLGKIESDVRTESKPNPNGGPQLKHEIRIDRLSGTKDGHVLYSSEDAELGTLDFHDQAEGNWKTSSVIKPAGHYGRYLSVSETTTRFTGGTEATEVKLRTIDSKTHKVINLSELVSEEDYQKMASAVTSGLNSIAGQHYQQEDMESLDSHMNNGFSLRNGKDGNVILTVAIPSNVESDGGKVAEFTFSLPASAIHQ